MKNHISTSTIAMTTNPNKARMEGTSQTNSRKLLITWSRDNEKTLCNIYVRQNWQVGDLGWGKPTTQE